MKNKLILKLKQAHDDEAEKTAKETMERREVLWHTMSDDDDDDKSVLVVDDTVNGGQFNSFARQIINCNCAVA